jgi:hypothetical protein
MSMAQFTTCDPKIIDPEDPRCARVVLSGDFLPVTDSQEHQVYQQLYVLNVTKYNYNKLIYIMKNII